MLGRSMHGVSYDEIHDEIVVPQAFAQSILTFRGGASGEEAPIRVIQGSRTQLKSPDKVAVDPVHNEIFVAGDEAVLVFSREANGNVAPIRILQGPDTQLGASEVAVDPVHNLLVVAGSARGGAEGRREEDGGSAVRIFNRTDQGNVRPQAVIRGPKTGLTGTSRIAVYPPTGKIIVNVSAGYGVLASDECFVGIWNIQDNGDVPPQWTIGGPRGILQQPRGVTLDPKNRSLIVSDKRLNAVLTFYFPEIF